MILAGYHKTMLDFTTPTPKLLAVVVDVSTLPSAGWDLRATGLRKLSIIGHTHPLDQHVIITIKHDL